MEKKKILHITPHMGGGVGKALSGITAYAVRANLPYRHSVLLLEKPEKSNFVDICRSNQVDVRVAKDEKDILSAIRESDIVQIEWWHHPLMCGWLAKFPPVPVRLVMWSHISGSFYPYIPPGLLRLPQKFIFTSRYSLDNGYWDEETRQWAADNCSVIHSSGGFEATGPRAEKKKSDRFVIGYLGTQSYSKLNPDFMMFCREIQDIPGIEFRMVGDNTNMQALAMAARSCGMGDKFCFVGYVDDVNYEFAQMDVFGYLLNPTHFGTTENALLEAMASELPVVCLDQCTEKYLVKHGETGLLVNSVEEYGKAIRFLFLHPEKRREIGNRARRYVLENFSVKKSAESLHDAYDEVLPSEKQVIDFSCVFGRYPYEFFLSCLPPDLKKGFSASTILPPILREKNKSSIYHFARTYPEDKVLQAWKEGIGKM